MGTRRSKGGNNLSAEARPLRVLYAVAELYPLVKTGGLADVAEGLPRALRAARLDVRILLPAYRVVMEQVAGAPTIAILRAMADGEDVRLLECMLPGTEVPVYLVDAPKYFDRPGGPYADEEGRDWHDNAARFALFGRVIASLGSSEAGLEWRPDIVHGNEWHTGLGLALLGRDRSTPASVFTIHNLAHRGLFPTDTVHALALPPGLLSPDRLEFHGSLSFIKGGLVFADRLVTVSPTYAGEILTPEHGFGLDGLLRHRAGCLRGILNGVDYSVWDPRRDPHIARLYGSNSLNGKRINKLALQRELGLIQDEDAFLLGCIARLTHQKGTDLLLDAMPDLMSHPEVQLAVLGEGEPHFHAALSTAGSSYPGRIHTCVGFREALAHRILAGSDVLLMPSRFEPCGLTQLYALRYGTVPIVRATGGLLDTVVDATDASLAERRATGFVFGGADSHELVAAVRRAAALWKSSPRHWRQLRQTGMKQDFSWDRSAAAYAGVYRECVQARSR